MNEGRRNTVILAFKRFDSDGNGYINIEDLKGRYNAKNHPDVKMGKKTEEDVLYEFLDTFEQHYALNVTFLLLINLYRVLIVKTESSSLKSSWNTITTLVVQLIMMNTLSS